MMSYSKLLTGHACLTGGADYTMIEPNRSCYLPNNVRDHASYAFNNYWIKFKKHSGICYFNAAAIITDLDPSILLTWTLKSLNHPKLLILHHSLNAILQVAIPVILSRQPSMKEMLPVFL